MKRLREGLRGEIIWVLHFLHEYSIKIRYEDEENCSMHTQSYISSLLKGWLCGLISRKDCIEGCKSDTMGETMDCQLDYKYLWSLPAVYSLHVHAVLGEGSCYHLTALPTLL